MKHHDRIIIRYSEIALKGSNRPFFEKILSRNIKKIFKDIKIENRRGRLVITSAPDKFHQLKYVFGIASYSNGYSVKAEINEIVSAANELISGSEKSFSIRASRPDKKFEYNSDEMNRLIGKSIQNAHNMKVDLKNPEKTIFIEVWEKEAIIFTDKFDGPGGLPPGSEGVAEISIKNELDELAAILTMKRGCKIFIKVGLPTILKKFLPGQEVFEQSFVDVIINSDHNAEYTNNDGESLRPLIGFSNEMLEELKLKC